MRLSASLLVLAVGLTLQPAPAAQTRTGRALAIEDYYRMQTVGNPEISPDGHWVVFTIATRIEEDNSTRTEVHVVPSNGSARARRVLHYGKDVTNAGWAEDSKLRYTADRQQWVID